MACFTVSVAEAAIVTAVKKREEKKEHSEAALHASEHIETKIPMSRKLKWLSNMLLGGSVLLMFEHIWHGEIVPWFPFLTAMYDKADTMEMLHEMATVGVTMAATVSLVWLGMCLAADAIVKRSMHDAETESVQ